MDFTTEQQRLLKQCRSALIQAFNAGVSVNYIISKYSHFVDKLLLRVWDRLALNQEKDVCLIAVGGYGRSELFLYSDIDLLILTTDNIDINTLTQLEKFIRSLWDIGLEVGHRLHSYSACIEDTKKDLMLISNLIDSRPLTTNQALYHRLIIDTDTKHMWDSEQFYKAKCDEQLERYKKYAETPYILEPNIKNNPGGLRDIQMIHWLVKRQFNQNLKNSLIKNKFLTMNEYENSVACQSFLWQIRFALHRFADKREERLLFNYQVEIAKLFNYQDDSSSLAIEKFMHDYYRATNTLRELNEMVTQLFREAIATKSKANIIAINEKFQLHNDYLEVKHDQVFQQNPSALLEVFIILGNNSDIKGVRANTIRLIRQSTHLIDENFRNNPRHNALFIKLLQQKTNITPQLQRMKRYGILGQYLPEFGRIIGQMQYDLYHHFTVDAHTLFVVRNLYNFTTSVYAKQFPLATQVMTAINKLEILYIAALFHDIAKGQGGDHSQLGALDVKNFCQTHGLNEKDTQLIVWLVENHLMMSHTAQQKDIYDPLTIQLFAEQVNNKDYLNHLYLLTVADICATNPNLWNSWKDSLLIKLYQSTSQFFDTKGINEKDIIEQKKQNALHILNQQSFETNKVLGLWGNFKDRYFLFESETNIAKHTQAILSKKDGEKTCILITQQGNKGGTEIFIYMPAHENRFIIATTILANYQLNILEAGIFTTKDNFSLDTYIVLDQHNQPVKNQTILKQIIHALSDHLDKCNQVPLLNPRRVTREKKHFNIETEITFQQDIKRNRTILQITSADRPGFLAQISKAFIECGLRLHKAKISTGGERVEDVFFISNQDNQAIVDKGVREKIATVIHKYVDN